MLWGEGGPPFRMLHVVTFAVWGAVTVPLVTLGLGTITVRRYHISPDLQKTAILLQVIQGNTRSNELIATVLLFSVFQRYIFICDVSFIVFL